MNKVYLTGWISEAPTQAIAEGRPSQLTFLLQVTHKSKSGFKSEQYRVNAWEETARWGIENLSKGQQIAVQGHLSQRTAYLNNVPIVSVEIAAEEFFAPAEKVRARGCCGSGASTEAQIALETEAAPS